MKIKEIQNLFKKSKEGDSIIQLKSGKIVSYFLRDNYNIYIYNEKTFQKLYDINLENLIDKYEKEKRDINDENEDDFYSIGKIIKSIQGKKYKNSIKEIDNNIILIGREYYLIEFNLYDKSYDYKFINIFVGTILEINILPDKTIIIFTEEKIILYNKENNEYIRKKEYIINDNWKMEINPYNMRSHNQFYSSYILPKNKLLLKSFSTKIIYSYGCVIDSPKEYSNSKIISLSLNDFKEIASTKTFDIIINPIILQNAIIFYDSHKFYLDKYIINIIDIESFKTINKIEIENKQMHKLDKLNDEHLIIIYKPSERKDYIFSIYKVENYDLIKINEFNLNFGILFVFERDESSILGNDKLIYILKDKRIILLYTYNFYVIKLITN